MKPRYWGIRIEKTVRISNDKYTNPCDAAKECYGIRNNFEYKDFGTRIAPLKSDKRRITLIKNEEGWRRYIKKHKKPPELYAIVDDGEMMGDSEFSINSRVEYREGMTLNDIRQAFSKTENCADFETNVNNIKVAWILDQKTLSAIDNSEGLTFGNDSAVYAANAMLKSIVSGLAVKTIRK